MTQELDRLHRLIAATETAISLAPFTPDPKKPTPPCSGCGQDVPLLRLDCTGATLRRCPACMAGPVASYATVFATNDIEQAETILGIDAL